MKTLLPTLTLGALALGLLAGFAAGRRGPEPAVQPFTFDKLPARAVNAKTVRTMISGQQGTLGRLVYQKGAVIPEHQHPNEQYSLITRGSVRVSIAGRDYLVRAGEGIIIPPNVPHRFEALEEGTVDIDFFTPRRQDWIDGTDTYSNAPAR